MFGAAMHYYLSENYFLSGERHHGCRSSEDGYVKRIQELGERKEKVLLNIKEIRRTLSQLNDEIKGMSDLSTTTTCNTKAQDGISSSTVQQQYTHDIETCRRIKASMDVQKSAIEQQIKVLSKKRDNNPHLFRQLSKISRQRQVLAISDDGFPRTPPRGTVFVHYDDGYIEVIANCTPLGNTNYGDDDDDDVTIISLYALSIWLYLTCLCDR
mmetsp:Transcript_41929/g.67427  ORF Transcript_41929/g.67427 Transcript_41929/m.67427 type:complete len:212 (+) Transcript_41929:347-982(+)